MSLSLELRRRVSREVRTSSLSAAAALAPPVLVIHFFTGSASERRFQFVRTLLGRPPVFPPGLRHQYSNAGYSVAAAMAERVMARSWESLIDGELLRPMGIRAVFGFPAEGGPGQPSGHVKRGPEVRRHDRRGEAGLPTLLAPAGALSMTIDEYGAFLRTHLNGLAGRDGVLKASTIRALHTPVPPLPDSDTLAASALGWGTRMTEWGRAASHAGSAGTFLCQAQLLAEQDLGFMVCTNVGGDGVLQSAQAILQSLRLRYARATYDASARYVEVRLTKEGW